MKYVENKMNNRKLTVRVCVYFLIFWLVLAGIPGVAGSQGGNLVQMNFDNIELRDLIRFVSNVMGKNFVFDENIVKGKVTILAPKSLSKDEVYRVFETVISYYGFSVVSTPEAIKVVKGADAKGMAVQLLDPKQLEKMPPENMIATYIHRLEYLDSNIMVGVLRPMMSKEAYIVSIAATNTLILIDTAANIQRLQTILKETDIPVSKQLGAIKVYNVQHTMATDLAKTLQQLMAEGKKAQTPKEKIFITAYNATNSLLISAPPEDMQEIERIIAQIDTLRPQVLVEAAIVEISTTKGQEIGIEWMTGANDNGVIGGFVQSGGSLLSVENAIISGDYSNVSKSLKTGFNVGVFGSNITWGGKRYPSLGAFIRALSSMDNVNILSTPQLLTMNNEEAEVHVGENRPYQTSTRMDSAGNPIYSYDYRDVGIKLKIKPYINKDGFVHLNLYQEVTKVITSGAGATDILTPTTLKRSTKTTVGVKDGQTVVISGLIKDDSAGVSQGIP
ncbi:MAG TPA: secretin N-terminal domain-containing protein, partial [Syntrophorhabdaceae bacterium]|nr:secretin N-terminal domain-containing protein [Syntrophorhabdaceae bacterium]